MLDHKIISFHKFKNITVEKKTKNTRHKYKTNSKIAVYTEPYLYLN